MTILDVGATSSPSPACGRGVRGEGKSLRERRSRSDGFDRRTSPHPRPLSREGRERGEARRSRRPRAAPETKSALTRADIVLAARSWLGTPYLHQGCAKGQGADCLGLIRGLYTELLGSEPETPPPYTPDWNERRPSEEPLLSAARRHLTEVTLSSPAQRGRWREAPEGALSASPVRAERAPSVSRFAPDTSPASGGGGRPPRDHAFKPGQILIFRVVKTGPAKHCGVVSGEDQFIHAYAGRSVIESWLARFWKERVAGVFEFPGVEE